MKKLNQIMALAGVVAAMLLVPTQVQAQAGGGGGNGGGGGGRQRGGGGFGGGGNFDPAQFQQRMLDRYKDTLEVTNDDEWTALKPLVQKVIDTRMQIGFGGGRGMRGGRGGGNNAQDNGNQGQGGRRGFGQPNPDADALQRAIDAKASNAELKAALAKFADARKAKQIVLEKAQADLRKVLSVRQEAIATANGLL